MAGRKRRNGKGRTGERDKWENWKIGRKRGIEKGRKRERYIYKEGMEIMGKGEQKREKLKREERKKEEKWNRR